VVPKAVLICALHQGDFVADTQNWTLTVLMPEVWYADKAPLPDTSRLELQYPWVR